MGFQILFWLYMIQREGHSILYDTLENSVVNYFVTDTVRGKTQQSKMFLRRRYDPWT